MFLETPESPETTFQSLRFEIGNSFSLGDLLSVSTSMFPFLMDFITIHIVRGTGLYDNCRRILGVSMEE